MRCRHCRATRRNFRSWPCHRRLQTFSVQFTNLSATRSGDQVVHDVAIQNLPVRFAIDLRRPIGADGPTHAGAFDIAYLGRSPNFVIMAASDELELARMVKTAADHNDGPIAFRISTREGMGLDIPEKLEALEIGERQNHQRCR